MYFMKKKQNDKKRNIPLLILGTLVIVAIAISLYRGGFQLTFVGIVKAGRLLESIWLRLLLGFLLGGFVQAVIPRELVSRWLGSASGLKGILIGSFGGVISTGGPYVWLPVVASIYKAGAGIGPVLALITARGILSMQMLIVWQIPFFGVELSLARYIPCLFVPPLVGILGQYVFRIAGWPTEGVNLNENGIK
jgi:uncharacterized membrane protein YraQ (UPF0718 family)